MGATASGKTDLAEALADQVGARLINADAFQIYRGMDIGTSKPASKARYDLIDIRNPDESFGVGEFIKLVLPLLDKGFLEKQDVIVVGGTGLYVRALFQEYGELSPQPDPELRKTLVEREIREGLESLHRELHQKRPDLAEKTDPRNPARVRRALERALTQEEPFRFQLPKFKKLKFCKSRSGFDLKWFIEERICRMIEAGWPSEVEKLIKDGYSEGCPGFRAIGYREIRAFVEGKLDLQEAIATTIVQTRQYAKRQRTWLRSEPELISLPEGDKDVALARALSLL
jgi:tRNA dimethylallyltransferase